MRMLLLFLAQLAELIVYHLSKAVSVSLSLCVCVCVCVCVCINQGGASHYCNASNLAWNPGHTNRL